VLGDLADKLVAMSGGPGSPLGEIGVVFSTAYAEDLQVAALVERAVRERGGRARRLPPTALYGVADSLFAWGRRLSVLYRFLPTEYLEGAANVPAIARAVRAGKVRVVSSFGEMFAQSKASFARAWDLLPERLVAGVMPYTTDAHALSDDELRENRTSWVIKRSLGRVGDQVFVGALHEPAEWLAILAALRMSAGESWVAQKFVPQKPVPTPWGDRFVTLGAYLLDGVFAGYFARLSPESHVSHEAMVVPVFVEDW
jgi:glutathionylspermidine synthase